jgi:AraC-like DNA-binding protein
LHANYAAFSFKRNIANFSKVQSRMLLWCKSGHGTITVNGEKFVMKNGSFIFIPWNHKIYYSADFEYPFFLAGIHIIPDLKYKTLPYYSIFHYEKPEEPEYQRRRDVALPGFESVYSGTFVESDPLAMLAEYIVSWFERLPRSEDMARNLARMLICELYRFKSSPPHSSFRLPFPLQKMLSHIDKNLENRIRISHLAKSGNCSKSTMFRLFRSHLDISPTNWILKRKMEHAAELLKKTPLSVKEIGAKLCIEDPYYFSKIFKKVMRTSASEYRKRHSLIPTTSNSKVVPDRELEL